MKNKVKKNLKYFLSQYLFLCAGGSYKKLTDSDKWIHKYYSIASFLKKEFKIDFEKFFFYLYEKIGGIEKNSETRKNIKRIWLNYFENASDNEKMFIYQMMYFTGVYDEDVTRKLVDFAMATKSKEYRYWITMDLGVMTFKYQDAVYNGYFQQRKILMKKISEEICTLRPRKINGENSEIKKICVLSYCLPADELNSSRRVTSIIVNGLEKKQLDICVININSFLLNNNSISSINILSFDEKQIPLISAGFNKKVKIVHLYEYNYANRLNSAIQKIYEFNPDIILDLSDEYSPISSIYSEDYCTIYKPFRSVGTSTYYYKILIGGGKETYRESNNVYNFMNLNDAIEWNLPEYLPKKTKKLEKHQVADNGHDFIIVSIGNNDFYIDEELSDIMAELLNSEESAVWLLVGRGAPQYLHKNHKYLFEKRKIIEWGFEDDLCSLCDVCDVVLRPNMKGGSGGTAIAAKSGLPIVMTRFKCDPMRWLGRNYIYNDTYKECALEIRRLIYDKKYYKEKQDMTKKCIDSALDCPEKWDELLSLLNSIKRDYRLKERCTYEKE